MGGDDARTPVAGVAQQPDEHGILLSLECWGSEAQGLPLTSLLGCDDTSDATSYHNPRVLAEVKTVLVDTHVEPLLMPNEGQHADMGLLLFGSAL